MPVASAAQRGGAGECPPRPLPPEECSESGLEGAVGGRWGRRGCPRRARAAPAREAPESEED